MCSGLFSSSANGARASRASAYFGLSTSTRMERSPWTMSGFVGVERRGRAGGAAFVFGGMGTVGSRDGAEHSNGIGSGKGRQGHPANPPWPRVGVAPHTLTAAAIPLPPVANCSVNFSTTSLFSGRSATFSLLGGVGRVVVQLVARQRLPVLRSCHSTSR